MKLEPALRKKAAEELRRRREQAENADAARRSQVYRRLPRVAQLDEQLRASMAQLAAAAFRGGEEGEAQVAAIRTRNLELQAERLELLVEAGFPRDWLDPRPHCPLCRDTGHRDGQPCSCFMELYRKAQREELTAMLDLGGQSFDTFDFDLYDDTADPSFGISARENMEAVYDICLEYARKFGRDSAGPGKNLFLNGGTGLGKTFLSACIAGEVSGAGWSVVYDTAVSILDRYEAARFDREHDPAHRTQLRRIAECDLLIMDDLGTELTTALSLSSLYTLINTRLITGKHTVINSNLTMEEIRRRYTPQILSRLEGEYTTLFFFGGDIRLKRRQQR